VEENQGLLAQDNEHGVAELNQLREAKRPGPEGAHQVGLGVAAPKPNEKNRWNLNVIETLYLKKRERSLRNTFLKRSFFRHKGLILKLQCTSWFYTSKSEEIYSTCFFRHIHRGIGTQIGLVAQHTSRVWRWIVDRVTIYLPCDADGMVNAVLRQNEDQLGGHAESAPQRENGQGPVPHYQRRPQAKRRSCAHHLGSDRNDK
jgi:hypothetical protein